MCEHDYMFRVRYCLLLLYYTEMARLRDSFYTIRAHGIFRVRWFFADTAHYSYFIWTHSMHLLGFLFFWKPRSNHQGRGRWANRSINYSDSVRIERFRTGDLRVPGRERRSNNFLILDKRITDYYVWGIDKNCQLTKRMGKEPRNRRWWKRLYTHPWKQPLSAPLFKHKIWIWGRWWWWIREFK